MKPTFSAPARCNSTIAVTTRPYATEMVCTLHDIILMTIWSVHSDSTSAAAYRRFISPNAPPQGLRYQD